MSQGFKMGRLAFFLSSIGVGILLGILSFSLSMGNIGSLVGNQSSVSGVAEFLRDFANTQVRVAFVVFFVGVVLAYFRSIDADLGMLFFGSYAGFSFLYACIAAYEAVKFDYNAVATAYVKKQAHIPDVSSASTVGMIVGIIICLMWIWLCFAPRSNGRNDRRQV